MKGLRSEGSAALIEKKKAPTVKPRDLNAGPGIKVDTAGTCRARDHFLLLGFMAGRTRRMPSFLPHSAFSRLPVLWLGLSIVDCWCRGRGSERRYIFVPTILAKLVMRRVPQLSELERAGHRTRFALGDVVKGRPIGAKVSFLRFSRHPRRRNSVCTIRGSRNEGALGFRVYETKLQLSSGLAAVV